VSILETPQTSDVLPEQKSRKDRERRALSSPGSAWFDR
jgi:hypothetical protein